MTLVIGLVEALQVLQLKLVNDKKLNSQLS